MPRAQPARHTSRPLRSRDAERGEEPRCPVRNKPSTPRDRRAPVTPRTEKGRDVAYVPSTPRGRRAAVTLWEAKIQDVTHAAGQAHLAAHAFP